MSIHVTVTGNPVCIKKRIILSDLEQIKKNERERRRRLRLAQVRQQSKDMSSKLLERAKNIAKTELNRFENKDSELHCLHNQKIMDIQQKYADDMEDIGLAHNSAASQLTHNSADVDEALEFERRFNHNIALERGKIASQRFKDSAKDNNPAVQQQERLRQVRNIENIRSSMVSSLAKTSSSKKNPSTVVPINISVDTNNEEINNHSSPKKQVPKKIIAKKSPVKLITKPTIKIASTYRKSKSPARQQKVLDENARKKIVTNGKVPSIDEIFSVIKPQQTKVSSHVNSEKAETITKYNPGDYRQIISESSEKSSMTEDSSSSSSSDFEIVDNKIDEKFPKKISKSLKKVTKSTSISSNKIYTYDHFTGQRNTYNSPMDLAERLDRTNEPNANEIAQRTSYTETNESIRINKKSNNHIKTQSRGQSAMLREQVRQDYQNLLKNLDHLSREERRLKAAASVSPKKYNELSGTRERRKELHDIKQRKMNRAFDDVQNERTMPLVERIITIKPSNEEKSLPQINSDSEEQNYPNITRDEQILEMLQKIERQKRLLLNEFGTNLPENIINSSMTRLFENTLMDKNLPQKITPEIEIIKITKNNKTDNNKQVKEKNTMKTKDKEIAVQTSLTEDIVKDKSTQVELQKNNNDDDDNNKENRNDETIKNLSTKSETLRYIEPIVTVIRHDVDDSSSNDTSPGIIINLTNKKLEVTPKTKKSSKKYEIKSLPTSGAGSPVKKTSTSTSAPASRTTSPKKRDRPQRKYKVYEKKKSDKHEYVDTSTDISFNHLNSTDNQQQQQFNEKTRIPRQSMTRNIYVSDTSTSYASLPAVQPGSYVNNDNNITPILQMLDSSSDIVRRVRDISPVSTPETPSPRTLRIPSNKPNSLRFGRALRFDGPGKSTDKQRQFNDRKIFSKNKNDSGENICTCKNSNCQYFHRNINEIRNEFRAINHPQVLKKYDELENICTERLASLNALINRGRDDSQVTDYSLIAPSDDTIMMQMPPPRPARSDVYSVKKLVESIEVIHSQLAKTLSESQKIMTGNIRPSSTIQEDDNELLSKKIQETSLNINDKDKIKKPKPKIISNETIKVDLERFKPAPLAHQKNNIIQDDIVEKLSKEILEQSKNVNKTSLRISPESHYSRKNKELTDDIDGDQRKFKATETEADVSKRNKIIPSTNIRARPPVSIINGQFGIDLTSPRHELSTIVEFDTSSTVINRSEVNIPSPIKEAKRILPRVNIPGTSINGNLTKDNLIIDKISPQQKNRKLIADKISPSDYEKTNKQLKIRSNGLENLTESLVINHNVEKFESSLKINQISHPVIQFNGGKMNEKITSSSSTSFSGLSGISEIYSTPTTRGTNFISSPSEDVDDHIKKLGMAWAVTTLRKTREASALSSSSNSDATGDLSRILSYKTASNRTNKTNDIGKKCSGLPDFSDLSSISIQETNKSTEYGVLMKARTSTPNIQCSNYSSKSSISMTSATTITSQENTNSIELLTNGR